MPLEHCSRCGKPDGLMACSRCHGATGAYCSKDCQAAHWKIHKPLCQPFEAGRVWGIKIHDNRSRTWSKQVKHVRLGPTHPILTQGELCPVTAACGFPLVIWSRAVQNGEPAKENNQTAVYLRIEPHDGFAPSDWQMNVGECIVIRQDREPLTKEALEIVHSFHSHLLDRADLSRSARRGGVFGQPLSPEWLRSFADDYQENAIRRGREGFDFFP